MELLKNKLYVKLTIEGVDRITFRLKLYKLIFSLMQIFFPLELTIKAE